MKLSSAYAGRGTSACRWSRQTSRSCFFILRRLSALALADKVLRLCRDARTRSSAKVPWQGPTCASVHRTFSDWAAGGTCSSQSPRSCGCSLVPFLVLHLVGPVAERWRCCVWISFVLVGRPGGLPTFSLRIRTFGTQILQNYAVVWGSGYGGTGSTAKSSTRCLSSHSRPRKTSAPSSLIIGQTPSSAPPQLFGSTTRCPSRLNCRCSARRHRKSDMYWCSVMIALSASWGSSSACLETIGAGLAQCCGAGYAMV